MISAQSKSEDQHVCSWKYMAPYWGGDHSIITYSSLCKLVTDHPLLLLKRVLTCEGHPAFWIEVAIKTPLAPLRVALLD